MELRAAENRSYMEMTQSVVDKGKQAIVLIPRDRVNLPDCDDDLQKI